MSAVLFVVCFIMGAGLVQSDDRLRRLESKLGEIDNSYRFILAQINSDRSQAVFVQETPSQPTTQAPSETTTQIATQAPTTQATQTTVRSALDIQPSPKSNNEKDYTLYTISKGDSIGIICRRFYGNEDRLEEILEINDIEDLNRICLGDVIKLPK